MINGPDRSPSPERPRNLAARGLRLLLTDIAISRVCSSHPVTTVDSGRVDALAFPYRIENTHEIAAKKLHDVL